MDKFLQKDSLSRSNTELKQTANVKRALLITKRITQILPTVSNLLDDVKYNSVLTGNLSRLPPINSKVIKIFLSSTFSDMATERNILMKSVYPKLKKYCRDHYGVEFQVIDMRWGVRKDSQLDHQGSELCYQEVLNCQNISVGPSFIAILGQRYGNHPPPAILSEFDYKMIVGILKEMGEDLSTIRKWYLCDTNNQPPVYNLKPVIDISENVQSNEIDEAKKLWYLSEQIILKQFEIAAKKGMDDGILTKDQAKTFVSSVTENEIRIGIIDASPKLRNMTSVFVRDIEDLSQHLDHPKIYKYIDLLSDNAACGIDEKLQQKMNLLKEREIAGAVSRSSISEYKVQWSDGINESDHAEYLHKFAQDFYQKVKNLIAKGLSERTQFQSDDLYTEVLQHSAACVNYVKHFQGRQDILNKIRDYIFSDKAEPLIIYGASGSGKTSVLAKAASLCQQWIEENKATNAIQSCVLLIRFLGTSPGTSSIRQTLKYLCRQIVGISGDQAEIQAVNDLDDFKEISAIFYESLQSLASDECPVYVFLDSVDQLNSSDSAYQLNWLRENLPNNVKMILSTLPDMFDLLETFKTNLPNEENYIEVKPLEENLCSDILKSLLLEKNRTLTDEQWSIVKTAFTHCSLPIYVNLVYHQVLSWRSYDHNADTLSIDYTVRGAIQTLFRKLEKKHGKIFTQHSLAYITASRNGLSESELDDLLSLDDDVLRDVFQYHLPPLIRIPPFCWSRLRHDIGAYLVEREADNTRVLFWYHRQFIEVAQEYFLSDNEFLKMIHSNMADYFLGIWGGGKLKPFVYPAYLAKKLKLSESIDADRRVPMQPYVSHEDCNEKGSKARFNLRKLNELPYHLVLSDRSDDFHDHIAFDYRFLFNKLKGTSRQDLIVDLMLPSQYVKTFNVAPELDLLINSIRIAAQTLVHDPISLSMDLIGRLFNFEKNYPRIGLLLKQCRTIGKEDCILIPLHNCFESGSGVLHTSFDLHMGLAIVTPANTAIVFSMVSNEVKTFDMNGNELSCFTSPYSLIVSLKGLLNSGLKESLVANICAFSKCEQEKELIRLAEKDEIKRKLLEAAIKSQDFESDENKDSEPEESDVIDNTRESVKEDASEDNKEKRQDGSVESNENDSISNSSDDNSDKNFEKKIEVIKFDFKNGHYEQVMEFKSEWFAKNNIEMDSIEFVGDHWVLVCDRTHYSNALLISLDDQEIHLKQIKAIAGGCGIDKEETYFFYADRKKVDNHYTVNVMNLKSRDKAKMTLGLNSQPYAVMVWKERVYVITCEETSETIDDKSVTYSVFYLIIFEIEKIDEELCFKEISKKLVITPSDKKKAKFSSSSEPCPCQTFTSSKYVVFFLCNNKKKIESRSVVHNINTGIVLNLKSSNVSLDTTDLATLGESSQCQILDDYDFLATTLNQCLLCIFDLNNGELIRKFKMGTADGFLAGSAPGSNLIMISHFPDESQVSSDERMFVMAKVYNLDVIKREANSPEKSISDEKDMLVFDSDKNQNALFDKERPHLFISRDEVNSDSENVNSETSVLDLEDFTLYNFSSDEKVVIPKKNNKEDAYSIELPENGELPNIYTMLKADLTDNFSDLHTFLWDKSGLFVWEIDVYSQSCKISAFKLPENLPNGPKSFHPMDRNDIPSSWEPIQSEEFYPSEVSSNKFVFSTPLYQTEKVKEFIQSEDRFDSFTITQVMQRPNYDLHVVIVYREDDELTEIFKADNEIVILFGGIRIYDLEALTEENSEGGLLHDHIFDVGPSLRLFQDGVHAINYKLHIYNVETGELVRKIQTNFQPLLLVNILLTPDDRYVIGQFYSQPYKIDFQFLDDDFSDDENYNTQPPRTLQIFRLSDGAMLANYMFENEPQELILSPCGNFLAVMCHNEIIRFFQISKESKSSSRSHSVKSKHLKNVENKNLIDENASIRKQNELNASYSETKTVNRKPNYLESIGIAPILSEAMSLVADTRPADPIIFIAQFLRDYNQT